MMIIGNSGLNSGQVHFYLRGTVLPAWLRILSAGVLLALAAEGSPHVTAKAESLLSPHTNRIAYPLQSLWNRDWAIGDFDGDRRSDLVRAERLDSNTQRYLVQIQFSSSKAESRFGFALTDSAEVNLEIRDVNSDHSLDLVITAGLLRRPVGLWINDGTGSFAEADASLFPESVWRPPSCLSSEPSSTGTAAADLGISPFCLQPPNRFFSGFTIPFAPLLRGRLAVDRLFLSAAPLYVRPPPCIGFGLCADISTRLR